MTKHDDIAKQVSKKSKGKRLFVIIAIVVALAVIGGYVLLRKTNPVSTNTRKSQTYTVKRDDLIINVTESGDIKAINSVDIKSEVEGRTSIISIVDEGTVVTSEDVNNGKVLVELDSSEIKQKLNQQEITFSNARSDLTDAEESLEIQRKQNESDIHAGQLKVKFALMDFRKYLGEIIAEIIINQVDDKNSSDTKNIDISLYINHSDLGGEAQQKLQELKNDIALSNSKLEKAKDQYEWTQKLFDANFVAETKLKEHKLEVESIEAQTQKSEIAFDLFKRYEFPKQAEKLLSDYYEAIRELERIEARARSQLAQKEAKLKNREATYTSQKERLEKLQKQLKACTIRATTPGQVVYSSSMMGSWQRQNRPIEIGAEIRERQKIISIPDTSAMKVETKVHETWIDKIDVNQPAIITIPAFTDKIFKGKVLKKAPLALIAVHPSFNSERKALTPK